MSDWLRQTATLDAGGRNYSSPLVNDPARAYQGIETWQPLEYDPDKPPRAELVADPVFTLHQERRARQYRDLMEVADALSPDIKENERSKVMVSFYVADQRELDPREVYLAWTPDGRNRYVDDYFKSRQRPTTYVGYVKNEIARSLANYRALNLASKLMTQKFDASGWHDYLETLRAMPREKTARPFGGIWDLLAKDIPLAVIETAPYMADMGFFATVGSLAGAGVGALFGPEGIPIGASIGRHALSFASSTRLNAAAVMADIMTMEDETTGEPLYNMVDAEKAAKIALYASTIAGGIMGGLDMLSFETMVGKTLLSKIGGKALARAGTSGLIRSHFRAFWAQYGMALTAESVTEAAQDVVGKIAQNTVAVALNNRGADYPVANWNDLTKLALQSARTAGLSSLVYALPGAIAEGGAAAQQAVEKAKVEAKAAEMESLARVVSKDLTVRERVAEIEKMTAETNKALAQAQEKMQKGEKFNPEAAQEALIQQDKLRYLEAARKEVEADAPDQAWQYSAEEWAKRQKALPGPEVVPAPPIAFESPVVEKIQKGLPNLTEEQAQGAALYAKLHAESLNMTLEDYMGSRFVSDIFDPRLAKELEAQGLRGGIDWNEAGKAIFYTTTKSDFTTWVHELNHLFARELRSDERAIAEKWLGVQPGAKWSTDEHERFAEAGIAYLLHGHVPNEQLRPVFQRFQQWVDNVYGSVKDRWPVTDDIRRVQDSLLSRRQGQEPVAPETAAVQRTLEHPRPALTPMPLPTSEMEQGAVPPPGPSTVQETRQQVRAPTTAPPDPGPTTTIAPGLTPIWIPVEGLVLSEEVPNFKEGAGKAGVIEPLEGRYVHEGTGPIVVWRRLNGRLEVITGRHRLDLARRTGEKQILAQIFEESAGFTAAKAAMFDAEANIRDGQGSVKDYAAYFRHSDITEEQASRRGLLGRDKGRKGFAIGQYASDDLYTLYRNGRISEAKAAAIAAAAPRNEALQDAGIVRAKELEADELGEYVRILGLHARPEALEQGDLFGRDESFMQDAAMLAKEASRKMGELTTELSALRAALRMSSGERAKVLSKYGFKTGDVNAVEARIVELTEEIEAWDNWMTDPAKHRELRKRIGGPLNLLEPDAAAEIARKAENEIPGGMLFQTDALHGTAHGFDTFSLHAIGKGEGAQVFGYGIYLTNKENIARHYAKVVESRWVESYIVYDAKTNQGIANTRYRSDAQAIVEQQKALGVDARIEAIGRSDAPATFGARRVVKAAIERDNFMGWYESLAEEQKKLILDGLVKLGLAVEQEGRLVSAVEGGAQRVATIRLIAAVSSGTGQRIYQMLTAVLGSPSAASYFLRKVGIDGIKYPASTLIGGNRAVSYDKGTNYVVFDPANIRITGDTLFQPDPHAQAVLDAIARGLPVPADRLAEYSSLPEVQVEIERRDELMKDADLADDEEAFVEWMLRAEGDKPATEAYYRMIYRAAWSPSRVRDPAVINRRFVAAMTPETVGVVMQMIVDLTQYEGGEQYAAFLTPEMRQLGAEGLQGKTSLELAKKVAAQIAADPAGWRQKLVDFLPTNEQGEPIFKEVADNIRRAEAETAAEEEVPGPDIRGRKIAELERDLHDRQNDLNEARRAIKRATERLNNYRQQAREEREAAKEAREELRDVKKQAAKMRAGVDKLADLALELHKARQHEKETAKKVREAELKARRARRLAKQIQRPITPAIARPEADMIEEIQILTAFQPEDVDRAVLSHVREYRRQNPKAPLPSSLVRAISHRNPREMTFEELEQVAEEVKELRKRGRERRRKQIEAENVFIQEQRRMFGAPPAGPGVPGVAALAGGPRRPGAGTRAAQKEATTSGFKKAYWSTLRMNRLSDLVDRTFGVQGTLSPDMISKLSQELSVSEDTLRRIGPAQAWLWEAVNRTTDETLKNVKRILDMQQVRLKELHLTSWKLGKVEEFDGRKYTHSEMIGVYLYSLNEDTLEALTMDNGIAPGTVNRIVGALTKEERAYGEWMMQVCSSDAEFDRLQEAYLDLANTRIERVEDYFPIQRLGPGGGSFVSEMVRELLEMRGYARRVRKPGFLKPRITRVEGVSYPPMRLDAAAVFGSHWERREWFIASAKLIKRLNRIFDSRVVKEGLIEKFGAEMPKQIAQYIGAYQNPNIYRAVESWDEIGRFIRGNVAFAMLGGNVLTILRQLPDIPQIMVQVGHPIWAVQAAGEFVRNPRAALAKVYAKAPQLQQRSYDRFIEELRVMDRTAYERVRNRVGEAAFLALKVLDNTTNAIGFLAVYNKLIHDGHSEQHAVEQARDFILRVRPAARGKDLSSLYRNPGSVASWFLMMSNQQNQQWNLLTYDIPKAIRAAAQGDFNALISAFVQTTGLVVGAIGMTMILAKWPFAPLPDEPEEWAKGVLGSLFGNIPFVGNFIEDGLRGEVARRGLDPFANVYYFGRFGEALITGADTERLARDATNAMWAVSQVFGAPTIQLKRFYRAVDTGDWWWVVGGPPKEQ